MLELFTTSTCIKCAVLEKKLENAGIPFANRIIDIDPEAQTDAIMLGITTLPMLRKGNRFIEITDVLQTQDCSFC